jgi:hypothetical protein
MTMNSIEDDLDLRARFNELRDEVELSKPPFVQRQLRPVRRRPLVWGVAAVGAAGALLATVWVSLLQNHSVSVTGIDLGAVAWTAPSDFLLDTPGREILRTLPRIGVEDYMVQSSDPESGVADTSG